MTGVGLLPVVEQPSVRLKPDIPEYVVISGKGGTGKTSLTASLVSLSENVVLADCDVDAANCHLLFDPQIVEKQTFVAGQEAVISDDLCQGCAMCAEVCRYDAIRSDGLAFVIDPLACEGCGVCARFCPEQAIEVFERHCGEYFVSTTRCGSMVHARLGIAAESSGKLVATVRAVARRVAADQAAPAILIDGPPGIGCPVIAALTGATAALVVTEPTVSGHHDVRRILELTHHFQIPTAITVNRWDLSPQATSLIEMEAREMGTAVLSRVGYDPGVTRAQIEGLTAVEYGGPAATDIRALWRDWTHWIENRVFDEAMR